MVDVCNNRNLVLCEKYISYFRNVGYSGCYRGMEPCFLKQRTAKNPSKLECWHLRKKRFRRRDGLRQTTRRDLLLQVLLLGHQPEAYILRFVDVSRLGLFLRDWRFLYGIERWKSMSGKARNPHQNIFSLNL